MIKILNKSGYVYKFYFNQTVCHFDVMSFSRIYKNLSSKIYPRFQEFQNCASGSSGDDLKARISDLIISFKNNIYQNNFNEVCLEIDNISDIILISGDNISDFIKEFKFIDFIFELLKENISVIQFKLFRFLSIYCYVQDDVSCFYSEDFLRLLSKEIDKNMDTAFIIFTNILTSDKNHILPNFINIESVLNNLKSDNIMEVTLSLSCLRNALQYSNYPFFANYENINSLIQTFCIILHRSDINFPSINFICTFISEIITNIIIYKIVVSSGIFHYLEAFFFVPEYFKSQKFIFSMFNDVTNFLFKLRKYNEYACTQLNLFLKIGNNYFFTLHTLYLIFSNENTEIDINDSLSMLRKYIKINNGDIENIQEYLYIIDKSIYEYRNGSFYSKLPILLLIYSIFRNNQKVVIKHILKEGFLDDLFNSLTIDDNSISNIIQKILIFFLKKYKDSKQLFINKGIINILSEIEEKNQEIYKKLSLLTNFFIES